MPEGIEDCAVLPDSTERKSKSPTARAYLALALSVHIVVDTQPGELDAPPAVADDLHGGRKVLGGIDGRCLRAPGKLQQRQTIICRGILADDLIGTVGRAIRGDDDLKSVLGVRLHPAHLRGYTSRQS